MNIGPEAVLGFLVVVALIVGVLWLVIRSAVRSANKRQD
jgi:hypothetical protein